MKKGKGKGGSFMDKVVELAKSLYDPKTTKTKDRRPKIPAGVPTPPGFNHPRMIKRNGGTVK